MPTFHWGGVLTGTLGLKPATGEGGQIELHASTANTTENGIVLDEQGGKFRIFGIASADGKTKTGVGTTLVIDPYGKTITGDYTFTGSLNGNAASATKLTTSAGSATQPIYFNNGRPTACTYTLGKSVPSNAVFTDTNTWRGIQDNLTSDSSTDSLSAKQGKALNTTINVVGGRAFQKRGEINATTDWNTLTDPGCYKVQIGATLGASATYHGPNEYDDSIYGYGLLFVSRAYDSDTETRTVQMYFPHRTDQPTLIRMKNSTAWQTWHTIYSTVKWTDIANKPSSYTPASHTHAYLPLSGGTLTGDLFITPATGEGGEVRLNAATANTTENGIVIDNYHGQFRVFGMASADGKTVTGNGTPLWINPYAKTMTGGYAFDGSAAKLSSSAGSATQPVYFSGGKPVTCTYTLGCSVPSNAKFTDTNTWRGIQDNLTSDSSTDSLSAKQGKALNTSINVLGGRSFQKRGEVSATTDWNTLTDFGCYKVQVATWGAAATYHGPNEYNTGIYAYGMLLVFRAYDSDAETRTVQMYFPHNASHPVLTRMKNKTAWHTWHTLYNTVAWSDIASKPTTYTPASHNHNYIVKSSDNTVNTANDNTKTWGTHNISAHFYSQKLLTDQPGTYGFVFNVASGSEVHQLWMTQASGSLCHRGGNGEGWSGSWRTIYDSNNMTAVTNTEIDAMF